MYRKINEEELRVDSSLGYVYFLDKEHPLAYLGTGKVYYHRHVASVSLNRWILTTEVVHHIDNNKLNNVESNLQVLTVDEHTAVHHTDKLTSVCPVCGTIFDVCASEKERRVYCSIPCRSKSQQKITISKEELEQLIWYNPYTKVGAILGISDVGVKKKAKSMGCRIPPPYFFQKTEEYRNLQRKLFNISPGVA